MNREDLNNIVDSTPEWLKNLAEIFPPSFMKVERADIYSPAMKLQLVVGENAAPKIESP